MKKIIIINLITIISIIFFLEISLNFFKISGLMGMQSSLINEKNGIHYLSPNSIGKVFNKKVYIDKNGFRVPKIDFSYSDEKGILIIGDSTTFGNGVLEEESFVGLLRNKYQNLNFFNSAVPGYQIKHHRNSLKKIKGIKEINKIIYFFTLNDVFDVSNVVRAKDKTSIEGDHKLKKIKIFHFLNSYLLDKSYLYMYLKGIGSDPSKRWFQSIDNFYSTNDISLASSYFKELKNFSKKNNAELYIVLLPYEYQTRNCKISVLKPQEKITQILIDNNLKFFDFTSNFCKLDNPKNYFYKFDAVHLSTLGHKLVFNLIDDEINF